MNYSKTQNQIEEMLRCYFECEEFLSDSFDAESKHFKLGADVIIYKQGGSYLFNVIFEPLENKKDNE